jgi:putative membrane protein
MWHDCDGMGWWMLWGGLMMVLFWGAIIALVVWAVQSLSRRHEDRTQSGVETPQVRTPLEIAKERYARGEIGRDEFKQLKGDLEET